SLIHLPFIVAALCVCLDKSAWTSLAAPRHRRYKPPRPKKKLTGSGRATHSSCWWCHKHALDGERLDLHGVAEVGQAFDQGVFLLIRGTAIEVFATEVLIHRPVLEHVVDRGKDGGGDGHDRLLGAAPGFDAVELGLQVAVFLFYRRPGALHQRGFEPRSALAQAIGSTLAGTLVVARRHASPCDKVCGRREPAHLDPDFGDDDLCGE